MTLIKIKISRGVFCEFYRSQGSRAQIAKDENGIPGCLTSAIDISDFEEQRSVKILKEDLHPLREIFLWCE